MKGGLTGCLYLQVMIFKAASVMPTLTIPGGNRTVLQSWEVSLQGAAKYPSPYMYNTSLGICQASHGMGNPLIFEWSIDTSDNDFQFRKLPQQYLATRRSAQLTIPGGFLRVRHFHGRDSS